VRADFQFPISNFVKFWPFARNLIFCRYKALKASRKARMPHLLIFCKFAATPLTDLTLEEALGQAQTDFDEG
jgi:hypothetical protein